MKTASLFLVLGFAPAGVWLCLSVKAAEPTEYEQYFLELTNRARSNPDAEVQRAVANSTHPTGSFSGLFFPFAGPPSLNEGPPQLAGNAYTIPSTPKQPLAFNTSLIDETRAYAGVCQANNAINHFFNGTDPPGRMTAAGYPPALPTNDGIEVPAGSGHFIYPGNENLAQQTVSGSPWTDPNYAGDRRREAVEVMHHLLFVDSGTSGRGHRLTMMVRDFREIGIGLDFGADPGGASVYVTQDIGHQTSRGPFITGVAYRELVADGFYTPGKGEASGGLTVQIRESGTTTQVAATTTFASGGYGVLVPAGHTYDVVFSGAQGSRTVRAVVVGTLNVKVDLIEPPVTPSISRAGNSATLTWPTTPGLVYRVSVSPDLAIWTPVASSQQTATSSTLSYVDPLAGAPERKFYRVDRL